MSFACRFNLAAANVANPIDITDLIDLEIDPTDASCSLQLNTDGTMSSTGNFSTVGPNWYLPTSTGVGANYWVRMTVTAGSNPTVGTVGSWLQLSSNRAWTWTRTTTGVLSATVTVELATDSGGANIIATKTGIVVSAEVDVA